MSILGAMQDWELRVSLLIDHAAREHGEREIVTQWADGSQTRTTWAGVRLQGWVAFNQILQIVEKHLADGTWPRPSDPSTATLPTIVPRKITFDCRR